MLSLRDNKDYFITINTCLGMSKIETILYYALSFKKKNHFPVAYIDRK